MYNFYAEAILVHYLLNYDKNMQNNIPLFTSQVELYKIIHSELPKLSDILYFLENRLIVLQNNPFAEDQLTLELFFVAQSTSNRLAK